MEHDGDYIIPIHIKIGQGTIIHFEKLLNEKGMRSLIPVYLEREALNFYLNREVKSEETYSVRATKQHFERERIDSRETNSRAVGSQVQRQL